MSKAMVKMGNNVWFFPGCGVVAAPSSRLSMAASKRDSGLRAIFNKNARLSPLILARLIMQR
jgi:hypothetical protein